MGITALKDSLNLNVLGAASSLTGREIVAVAPAAEKLSLVGAASLIRSEDASFQRVTKDKGDFHQGLFIRAKAWCQRTDMTTDGSNARVTVGFIGVVTALAATMGYHIYVGTDPNVITAITGATIAAPFLGSRFAVAAIDKLAESSHRKALRRHVQLDAIKSSINQFRESSGREKALRGVVLTSWFDLMDAKRALSGPARVELLRVKQELEACNPGDRADAQRLFDLTKMIDQKGDVSGPAVDAMVEQLQTASADERAGLASEVVHLLDANGRDVEYKPGHKLHELTLG